MSFFKKEKLYFLTVVTKSTLNEDYKISQQNYRVAETLESTLTERGFIALYIRDTF